MKKFYIIIFIFFINHGFAQNEVEAELLEINYLQESVPKNIFVFQNQVYFTADDSIHGRELWKIENDVPVLIMDLTSGYNDSFNDNCKFLITEDFIYFTTANGKKLWKSDGTEESTTLLLSNTDSEYPCFSLMVEFNSKIYFSYNDGSHGLELWETDGTVGGTSMLKDIYLGSNGSSIEDFFVFNNTLFFTAIDGDGTHRREIWKSDGTEPGTMMLKDIGGETYADGVKPGNDFLILNNHFYFYGYTQSYGYELWKSDGTEEGTQMVKDIFPGYNSSEYTYNRLYGAVGDGYIAFRAFTPDSGYELWRSDGTESGTFKIKEINPNNGSYGDGIPNPGWLNTSIEGYNGKVYFTGSQGGSWKLWVTDGTEQGTVQFLDLDAGEDEYYKGFKKVNNKLYFFNSRRVMQTDGVSSQIFVNMQNDGGVSQFQPFLDKVFFVKNSDEFYGLELWESKLNNEDLKVYDVNLIQSSSPRNFASLGDKVLFFGQNYTYYEVPMISDGTQEGTKSIVDNPPFRVDNNDAAILFKVGNNMFFKGYIGQYVNMELYKTDGTPEGTGLVKDINVGSGGSVTRELYVNYNEILYFLANDGVHGEELWRSDGTEEGTYMVADFSGNYTSSTIIDFEIWNGFLYFSGSLVDSSFPDPIVGIWKTDGTEGGTEVVIQWESSGLYDNGPHNIIAVGDKLFFTKDESNSSYGDNSLYVTQGTNETTAKLGEWSGHSVLEEFVELNGKLIFDANKPQGSENLFISDGTIEGTHEINENLSFYNILKTKKCGNQIYFTAGYTGQGGNLWVSNGTSNGTIQLSQNIVNIDKTTCYNNNLVFLDSEEYYAYELKVTNGQQINSVLVDFNYSELGQNEGIDGVYANENLLFLTIKTKKHGNELYVSNPDFVLSTEEINEGLANNNQNVLIYPNPTSSEINVVSNDQSKIKQIQIYDLTGKLIEIGVYNSNEVKLNVGIYNSGIYLLKVNTEKNSTTKKVVVK
ncbi:T9SS type A sorting domain-containing protein [Moheibacter lacus]|uniref:T9SS type A sorting domain-containing protein n=1 Tax=Moheibacter lacus TaxID=2745851 RepID=A0A838ZPY3_9FLAO|nr:T9SS type A sorting domain-containing protein [Moheibacter lacus]MBA5629667.1 T9SS type A sorting domain-containing protein [Moheibacter lacus]